MGGVVAAAGEAAVAAGEAAAAAAADAAGEAAAAAGDAAAGDAAAGDAAAGDAAAGDAAAGDAAAGDAAAGDAAAGDAAAGDAAGGNPEPVGPGDGPQPDIIEDDPAAEIKDDANMDQADDAVKDAEAKIPDAEKTSTWKDFFSKAWGVTKTGITVVNTVGGLAGFGYLLYCIFKKDPNAQSNATKAGWTPEQYLEWNEQVSVWSGLSLADRYNRMHSLFTNVSWTPQQKVYLCNWLYNTFWTTDGSTFKINISSKLSIYTKLSQQSDDASMWTVLNTTVTLPTGQAAPFALGCNLVVMALTVKYNLGTTTPTS